jgi:hypothetical protein
VPCPSALLPTPVPIVVETINPTAFSLGHRARPLTPSSPTSLVVTLRSHNTRCEFLIVFPYPTIYLSRVVCLPLFGRRLLAICVCRFISPSPHQTIQTQPPSHCFTTIPHCFHLKPCHPPNFSLLFLPPSPTIHAPSWCHGSLQSTGQRATYSPNGTPSGFCSACATTLSGSELSSTSPLGGAR